MDGQTDRQTDGRTGGRINPGDTTVPPGLEVSYSNYYDRYSIHHLPKPRASHLLLRPIKRAELPFFIWIKGGANFEPTTPVHKKRLLMRQIFLSLRAFTENDHIAF